MLIATRTWEWNQPWGRAFTHQAFALPVIAGGALAALGRPGPLLLHLWDAHCPGNVADGPSGSTMRHVSPCRVDRPSIVGSASGKPHVPRRADVPMKPSKTPPESFGALPVDAEAAEGGANGVLLPHSDSDAQDLQRVRNLLFGATARAQSSRVDSVEALSLIHI